MRKSAYFVLILVTLGALSMHTIAYADDLQAHSPFEKMYDSNDCRIQFYFNSTDVKVLCWWDYTFPMELIQAMPSPIDSPSDYEHMKAVENFIEEEKENILKVLIEETLSSGTDDRERVAAARPPVLSETAEIAEELCFGGTTVEQQIHFENETLNIAREFDGNIRSDIDKLRTAQNSEFCIAYQKARSLGYDFAEIQKQDPSTVQEMDMSKLYFDERTADPTELDFEAYFAQNATEDMVWMTQNKNTGWDFKVREHKYPEVRTLCMTNPASYELMCPLQGIDDYFAANPDVAPEVQKAASENAALIEACADAWDRVDSGKRHITQWEPMLLDDTCVKHIPGLFGIRHEAIANEQNKLQ